MISQLAPRFRKSEEDLEQLFEEAARILYDRSEYPFGVPGDWHLALGVTPRMILWVCKKLVVSCHGFMDNAKVLQYVSDDARTSISFSWGSGHIWLLEPDVNRSLAQKSVVSEQPRRLHALEEMPIKCRDEGPWTPWPDDYLTEIPTGVFGTTNPEVLLQVRRAMPERGRCPRVIWNTMEQARLLKYVKTKRKTRGVAPSHCVRSLPSTSTSREPRRSWSVNTEVNHSALGSIRSYAPTCVASELI